MKEQRLLQMIFTSIFIIFFLATHGLAEERLTGWQCPGGFCSRNASTNWGDWHGYTGHIGIDYMRNSGFPVYAIEHGVVEDYRSDLSNYGSQCGATGGAMLIHHIAKGHDGYLRSFWSVYGHMYKKDSLQIGDIVEKGEAIGDILYYTGPEGSCDKDWSHLHFGIHQDNEPAGTNRFRGVCSSGSDCGWTHPMNFLDDNFPGDWDNVDCDKLEDKYPSIFQQKNIYSCQKAEYFYPNQYVVSYYTYNGMFGYWGIKEVWFKINSGSEVVDSSDNIPPGIGYGGGGEIPTNNPFDPPNLQIRKVEVHDSNGHLLTEEESYLQVGETVEIRVWPVSREADAINGMKPGKDNIETDTFYKIAMDESLGNEGKFIDKLLRFC